MIVWLAPKEIDYIKHIFRNQRNSVYRITVRGEFTVSMITDQYNMDITSLRDFCDEIIYLELYNREIVTTYEYD